MKLNSHYIKFLLITLILFSQCKNDTRNGDVCSCPTSEISDVCQIKGYEILELLPGIWNGPVNSQTILGSFPEWIVDFRPNASSEVSAKNELNPENDIFMNFFVVKENCEYKVCFRNGGFFAGLTRVSYMYCDSTSITGSKSFFRFVDAAAGQNRVYSDVSFENNTLTMHTYTNQYNTLSEPTTHFIWTAELQDRSSTQDAIEALNLPERKVVKDFTTTFNNLNEAVFYDQSNDPYPEEEHPYLGTSEITINIDNSITVNSSNKMFILITTQPLFNGLIPNFNNLKYRSRYVVLEASPNTSFNFNYMHPGSYYVNAIYDANGNNSIGSGDYINQSVDVPFMLNAESTVSKSITINFEIP